MSSKLVYQGITKATEFGLTPGRNNLTRKEWNDMILELAGASNGGSVLLSASVDAEGVITEGEWALPKAKVDADVASYAAMADTVFLSPVQKPGKTVFRKYFKALTSGESALAYPLAEANTAVGAVIVPTGVLLDNDQTVAATEVQKVADGIVNYGYTYTNGTTQGVGEGASPALTLVFDTAAGTGTGDFAGGITQVIGASNVITELWVDYTVVDAVGV